MVENYPLADNPNSNAHTTEKARQAASRSNTNNSTVRDSIEIQHGISAGEPSVIESVQYPSTPSYSQFGPITIVAARGVLGVHTKTERPT